MRILIIFTVFVISACTPEIRTYMADTKHDIISYSYGSTFRDFFIGSKIKPTKKQQKIMALKEQCAVSTEKRVRYISGINDEAWYDQCLPANIAEINYPAVGPERLEMTSRPPYSKLWTAERIQPKLK